jgi:adenosylcobyric acid synthase
VAKKKITDIGTFEHGGNIHRFLSGSDESNDPLLDFSANINPLGPPAWLRSLVNHELRLCSHYPEPNGERVSHAVSARYGVDERLVVPANGTTELIYLLPRITATKRVIIPVPCYIDYLRVFKNNDVEVVTLPLSAEKGFSIDTRRLAEMISGGETVIFGNPANPTGTMLADAAIIECASAHPQTLFVIDEAFRDFCSPGTSLGGQADNIITLNSLTKFYAIPGLRAGFGIFPEVYRSAVDKLLPPWSMNLLAQKTAVRALADRDYQKRSSDLCEALRTELQEDLAHLDRLQVYDSMANYLLIELVGGDSGEELYRRLLEKRILIRRCGNYQGLGDNFIRVAVKNREQNRRLVESLSTFFSPRQRPTRHVQPQARSIMFQGTSSNAGKSVLAAAMCRILLQDGYRVCPFKAQNMSLNSHVTLDGGEMGRAQVVQAQAAKVEPDWRMNPVLLKPNSDTGSQVIVNGRPLKNMNVHQYHAFKERAWEAAATAYDELSAVYDVMVLEGAGSPGEVNLKRHDFVNMKMARHARAPVLLVGDIDRGGVYASFAGIMDVLEEWERELVGGFVVNKFRGDQSLLEEAHRFIRDHTGRDVYGVVPYITDMSIPQEDSVALRDGFYRERSTGPGQVEICVVDLPHIANFTDIDPLYHEHDVNIRFVSSPGDIGRPAALIIPGSKNVAADMQYLRERSLDTAIIDYAQKEGGHVVGICGGYQMLGILLHDPHRIETDRGTISGLGLIDIETELAPEKTLVRREGTHIESGSAVVGYEIHHGRTSGSLRPLFRFSDGQSCGSCSVDDRVWGAYLHGLFDADGFRRWFVDQLRSAAGMAPLGAAGVSYNVDRSLDELADLVRASIDIEKIYTLMNLGS